MGTFGYGQITDHQARIGVWLRTETNPDDIELIKKSKQKRIFETVIRVIVLEHDGKSNMVYLQIWCKSLIDSIRGKNRYNVFCIKVVPNPDWSCESDLGRGYEKAN